MAGLKLDNVIIRDSIAIEAGAIYAYDSDIVINGSQFINNTTEEGPGGAISIRGGRTEILGSTFSNNHSESAGGAVFARGFGRLFDPQSLTIRDSSFVGNQAVEAGGAIHAFIHHEIVNSTIRQNKAQVGGGIYVSSEFNGNLQNVKIEGNTAQFGPNAYSYEMDLDRKQKDSG